MHTALLSIFLVAPAVAVAGPNGHGNNKAFLSKAEKEYHLKRPNILFLMSDSMDGRMVDHGSDEASPVELPFLRDFFAKKGASFVRSYSNNPMCVPSRTSMMTGRRSDVINVFGNEQGLAANPNGVLDDTCVLRMGKARCKQIADEQGRPQTIFSTFQKLGYNVHMNGRLHIGAGMLNKENHSGIVDGKATCAAFDDTRAGEVTRSADIRHAPGAFFQKTFLDGALENGGDTNFATADWVAMRDCKNWISELPIPSEATKPFFLHCSLNLPHYSFSTNSTWLERVNDSAIKIPTWKPGFPDKWHPYDSFMSIAKGVDGNFSKHDIKKLARVYYGMAAEADDMLAGVWHALTAKGYNLKNTYVIYVSDHGELKFEHRQVYKASMYEGSVRVPLQIAGPGITEGKRVKKLTSLLDVFPTLLDMAMVGNATYYANLSGKSLLAAAGSQTRSAPADMRLSQKPKDERDFVLSQYNWVEANTGIFMVRSGPWKLMTYGRTYSAYKDYQPQLYNVEKDPEELDDLAAKNPKVVKKLEERLRQELDPDEVDRRVMKDDYERLLERFHDTAENAEERTKKMLMLVPRDYVMKFTNWLGEAKSQFGEAEPASVGQIGLMASHTDMDETDTTEAEREMEEANFGIEVGDQVVYVGEVWKQRGSIGKVTELKDAVVSHKVEFDDGHISWCAKHSLKQAYKVGERVERRDHGETWFTGLVTDLRPIKVDGLVWDEVRKYSKSEADDNYWSSKVINDALDQNSALAMYNEQAKTDASIDAVDQDSALLDDDAHSSLPTHQALSLLNQKAGKIDSTKMRIDMHKLPTFQRESNAKKQS